MSEKDLQEEILDLKAQVKKLQKNNLGLVFEDKPEDVVTDCEQNIPVLKEVKTKRIISDEKNLNNLLIEGDNYHSLSVLNYTHKKNIDLIYIDPPYNRGGDFKYNDDYVDKDDAYRHSKWLSFMRKRLELANNLLKPNGVIFISIDDNEQAHLKVLCDQIFGESNFVTTITVQVNKGGRDYLPIATTHEYILCYFKSGYGDLNELQKEVDFVLEDDGGKYELRELRNRNPRFTKANRPNLYYPFYINPKSLDKYGQCLVSLEKSRVFNVEVFPLNSSREDSCWRWGQKLVLDNISNQTMSSNVVAKQRRDGGWNIYEKSRKATSKAKSIWDETDVRTEQGTIDLRELGMAGAFDHPKPVYLVKKIIEISTSKDSIVLDFMAGSGTTGQAVLEMNKKDGGNRRFILCTNSENNICEEVTYKRIKRVVEGYKNKNNEKVDGLGGNLSYYKTDLVNIEKIHKIPDEAKIRVTYEVGEMIAVRENTLNEAEKNEWWQIFEGKEKITAIYFKEDKLKLAELVEKMDKKNTPVVLYIFSWGKNEYRGEYSSANIRVKDIPEPILEVYKEINRL